MQSKCQNFFINCAAYEIEKMLVLLLNLLSYFYEAKYFHASNEVKLEECFCATILKFIHI